MVPLLEPEEVGELVVVFPISWHCISAVFDPYQLEPMRALCRMGLVVASRRAEPEGAEPEGAEEGGAEGGGGMEGVVTRSGRASRAPDRLE